MTRDYYEILGVDRNASPKEIKRAYRNIMKLCHPDSPDFRMDPDKIYQVQTAYENLGDSKKREDYDRRLKAQRVVIKPGGMTASGPFSHFHPLWWSSNIETMGLSPLSIFPGKSNIFDSLLRRRSKGYRDDFSGSPGRRGLEIVLTTEEAARGGVFTISIPGDLGEKVGSFVIRIPPDIRPGTRLLLDLDDVIGIVGAYSNTPLLEITILVK